MAMKQVSFLKIGIGMLFLVVLVCCKKKKPDDNNNNPPISNCNLTMSTLVANDTIINIVGDTAYATGNNTLYTEHKISGTQGCSVEFEGSTFPVAGTYAITPIFNDVKPGSMKVYIQYFINGTTYIGQGGDCKFTGEGTGAIIEFCKINFKESFGNEKTISLKSDSE